ncbi:MAG: diguanylate cyclase [Sulfuritalea sp.]|nr:diguanylate cyclase [Sulfuritalea sp.]
MNSIVTVNARPHRWVVAGAYRVRIATFALVGVPIGLHLYPRAYGAGIWALFVLQFLIYPHLMHWLTRKAGNRRWTDLDNMMVDAAVCGAWAAGLGFPLWISAVLFLVNLLSQTITRGISGVLICAATFVGGALASTAAIAFHVSTDTDGLVTLASIIGMAAYLSLIGIEFFAYIQKLHKVRDTLDSQKQTLENANAVLNTQIGKINDLQEKLREQANRDSLTGLFNRRYLEGTLERELARCRREGAPLSMLMLDIDHFKRVNDTHGHQAGDEVLRVFSQLLLEHARAEDIVCRYGGEEFLLILPKMPLDIARERAAQLLLIFQAQTVSFGDLRIRTTVSIGIAATPDHGDAADDLIRCADDALYQAKRAGRNRAMVFDGAAPGAQAG